MRRLRHTIVLTAVAAALPLGLTACGSSGGGSSAPAASASAAAGASSGAVDTSGVTIRFADIQNTTQTVLRAAGQLDNLPYKISWSNFPTGTQTFAAISTGAVDETQTGELTPLFAQAKGVKFKVLSVYGPSDDTQSPVAILVPKNSPIHTIADLKGKTVTYTTATFTDYLVHTALKSAGLSYSDIKKAPLAPAYQLGAITSGSVDAASLADPQWATAELTNGWHVLVTGVQLNDNLGFVSASTGSLADPKRAAAERDFAARIGKAKQWAGEHPAQWAAAYSKLTHLAPAIAARVTSRNHTTGYATAAQITEAITAQQKEADNLLTLRQLPKTIDVASTFDQITK